MLGILVAMGPTVHAAFWEGQRDIGGCFVFLYIYVGVWGWVGGWGLRMLDRNWPPDQRPTSHFHAHNALPQASTPKPTHPPYFAPFLHVYLPIYMYPPVGINTLAYVLCCLPAALSQLAKERAVTHFAQPMNVRALLGARVFTTCVRACFVCE